MTDGVPMPECPPALRIFLIGFNKCGTTSFHDFFRANDISSVHWRGNTLAITIHRHLLSGHRPLLDGLDQWTAYTDMVCIPSSPWGQSNSDGLPVIEACRAFRELQISYPESLFILNTRDPLAWVRSRLQHDQGRFAQAYLNALASLGIINQDQMIQYWLQQWHEHHAEVLGHFREHSPEKFLLFHIEHTPQDALFDFLSPYVMLKHRSFPHHHRTMAGG